MGYDFIPIKKGVESISIGAFSWPIMLQDTGMGYLLGYGAGRQPAQYVFQPGKNGSSPVSNDGYKVSSSQAKIMASIARGYISVKRFINKEWDALPELTRKHDEEFASPMSWKSIYLPYTSEKFLIVVEQFADFAEKSGGFKIH